MGVYMLQENGLCFFIMHRLASKSQYKSKFFTVLLRIPHLVIIYRGRNLDDREEFH